MSHNNPRSEREKQKAEREKQRSQVQARRQKNSNPPTVQQQSLEEARRTHREKNARPVSRSEKPQRPPKLYKTSNSNQDLTMLLDTQEHLPVDSIEYPTPAWFNSTVKADVSVIVPLYKSDKEVVDLINSWDWDSKLKVEIIFVDDCCPRKSKEAVLSTWSQRSKHRVGKIIVNVENRGYGGACNVGAQHATGDYLIFLNADTCVTPNWIDPMIARFNDPSIGIVGNLQLKQGGQWNGYIDSAGSEWRWDALCFVHIGRHTYNFKNIEKPFHPQTAPKDVLYPGERDMVTGCCFAIRKSLFDKIGGFNLNYRIGYWEDSELCMVVKELGFKIFFEPSSIIHHKLGHSQSGEHKFQSLNRSYFLNKWVYSNRIDSLVTQQRKSQTSIRGILLQRKAAHGDVLVAAGVAAGLKKKYPDCQISFVTQCPKVLLDHPYIDKVLEDHKNVSERTIQLYYNLDMAYEYRPKTNILEAYAEAVGVPLDDCQVVCATSPLHTTLPSKYVVFHPGRTNWVGRDWSEEGFENIAQRLIQNGHRLVCVGRAGDRGVTCDLDLRGKTTIQEMAYVIQKSSLFIGIDSMPMHVAQSFNIPGVCFFGSVDPATRLLSSNMRPIVADDLNCLGCHHRKPAPSTVTNLCETGRLDCEKLVSVEKFWKKVQEALCQV